MATSPTTNHRTGNWYPCRCRRANRYPRPNERWGNGFISPRLPARLARPKHSRRSLLHSTTQTISGKRGGRMQGTSGQVRITTGALMDAARARAGLIDFGDEWFIAPLEHLVTALNEEARLKSAEAGPVQRITHSLIERLQLVDTLKRQPEILDEKVHVAGAVLGLPRTGSTMLQRLLGSSPQLTSGFWWEVTFPLPFPGEQPGDPTPRQEAAKAAVEYFYTTWPEFRSIHPMDAMAQ